MRQGIFEERDAMNQALVENFAIREDALLNALGRPLLLPDEKNASTGELIPLRGHALEQQLREMQHEWPRRSGIQVPCREPNVGK